VITFVIIKSLLIVNKKDKWCNCSTSSSDLTSTLHLTDEESLINIANGTPTVVKVTNKSRLHFLDNIKTFLTFIVVCHHVGCSFGACGPNSWYLIIGSYNSDFQTIVSAFVTLNQGYFMCLFFFISAYFTPSSYSRKGCDDFHYDKAKRLGIPLLLYYFILGPICVYIGLAASSNSLAISPIYIFNSGPW
jgi:hypothetical protein